MCLAAHIPFNLMVSDAAKTSKMQPILLCNVEKLYTLFSGSIQRYSVLKENMYTSPSSPGVRHDGKVALKASNFYAIGQKR